MMHYTDNPIGDYDRYSYDQERSAELLPECSECGEKIYDEMCYEINGELICESCMENYYKVETPIED